MKTDRVVRQEAFASFSLPLPPGEVSFGDARSERLPPSTAAMPRLPEPTVPLQRRDPEAGHCGCGFLRA